MLLQYAGEENVVQLARVAFCMRTQSSSAEPPEVRMLTCKHIDGGGACAGSLHLCCSACVKMQGCACAVLQAKYIAERVWTVRCEAAVVSVRTTARPAGDAMGMSQL